MTDNTDCFVKELENGRKFRISLNRKRNASNCSQAWFYFGELQRDNNNVFESVDANNVYCMKCLSESKITRYGNSSTGNLIRHLKDNHNIEIAMVNENKKFDKITAFFGKSTQSSQSQCKSKSNKKFELIRQITTWFSRDLIPFNKVSTDAMQEFCRFYGIIQQDESMPSDRTLAQSGLNDMYQYTMNIVKNILKHTPDVLAITFDCWTDNYKRISYITYTLHWIDQQSWKNKSISLGTSHFPHPHTGEEIKKNFQELVKFYDLDNKTLIAVTDCGSNVVKACRLLQLTRLPCVAHGLHNLVTVDLLKSRGPKKEKDPEFARLRNKINDLLKKMRDTHTKLIYKQDHLKAESQAAISVKMLELLEKHENIEEELNAELMTFSSGNGNNTETECSSTSTPPAAECNSTEFHSLKRDVSTRWNSILTMVASFVENADIFKRFLEKEERYDLIMNGENLEMAKELLKLLELFRKATEVLSGSKYPTLNMVLLFKSEIETKLIQNEEDMASSPLVIQASKTLLKYLEKRIPLSDENICASLLDPGLINLSQISKILEDKEETKAQFLKRMLLKYKCICSTSELEPDTSRERGLMLNTPLINLTDGQAGAAFTAKKEQDVSWKRTRSGLIKKHIQLRAVNNIDNEIKKYLETLEDVEDPNEWWKEHMVIFPTLAKLARYLLCIPATSAPSERAFSQAGCLVNAKRSNINPSKAHKILFIHDNYNEIKEFSKEQ